MVLTPVKRNQRTWDVTDTKPYRRTILGETTEQAIIDAFGPQASRLYAAILDEYLWLTMELGEFNDGFSGNDPSMLHVYTISSRYVERSHNRLVENIIGGISRLTDTSEGSGGINRLKELFPEDNDTAQKVSKLANEASTTTLPSIKKLVKWRHKRIAHGDTRDAGAVIPKPTLDEVRDAITKIGAPIKLVWINKLGHRRDIDDLENRERHAHAATSRAVGEHVYETDEVLARGGRTLAEIAGVNGPHNVASTADAVEHMCNVNAQLLNNSHLTHIQKESLRHLIFAAFKAAERVGKTDEARANYTGAK